MKYTKNENQITYSFGERQLPCQINHKITYKQNL